MYSDNSTTFVGADNDLTKLSDFLRAQEETITNYTNAQGIC